MLREDSYTIKFQKLQPWMEEIFRPLKKDLRNDHLLKASGFVQKHFPKRPLDKLTTQEFASAYMQEIVGGDEELGEKVVTRWMMKHGELYQFFAEELSKINPQFDAIESLAEEVSARLLNTSVAQFGSVATYIFCVMNAVVLSEEQFLKLREMALADAQAESVQEARPAETVESVHEHYTKEIRKLTEKYEKRMQGIERKYVQDVEGLKKQISQLHKKMGERTLAVG
jgi:hypothetical protein